ncbi:MAG: secondary thiamine-phosphate synthase enzyme YjbQ [Acidimicrobiia bacterium]|nr:secondary thiamine-phosphate synthase enzyme YjbQ [Acidimicrobiia bacterium]
MEEPVVIRQATRRPTSEPVVLAESSDGRIRTEALHLQTEATNEFWDVTDFVRSVVANSTLKHGQVTVSTPHTTTSIVINESETGFLNDYRRAIDAVVPEDSYYEHDDHSIRTENLEEDEYINGHSHVRQLIVGQPSVTIPVVDGEVLLGQWQRVMFVELDQARPRRLFFHAQGS